MRGRSYAGNGGMVTYLGTGDGNRTVKSKRDHDFVHGTGFQNSTMHSTAHRNRNNPQFASVQTSHNTSHNVGARTGFTHLNVDMTMQEAEQNTFPDIGSQHPTSNAQSAGYAVNVGHI